MKLYQRLVDALWDRFMLNPIASFLLALPLVSVLATPDAGQT
jgi:hypothetical protein